MPSCPGDPEAVTVCVPAWTRGLWAALEARSAPHAGRATAERPSPSAVIRDALLDARWHRLSADVPDLVELGLSVLRSMVSNEGPPAKGRQCSYCPAWQGTVVSTWG